jgi:hypothetical protein
MELGKFNLYNLFYDQSIDNRKSKQGKRAESTSAFRLDN